MLCSLFSYQAATVWEGTAHLPAITLLTPTSGRARRDRNRKTNMTGQLHILLQECGDTSPPSPLPEPLRADNFRFSFTLYDMSTRRPTNRSNHQYHGNTQWAEWFRMVLYLVESLSQWLGSFPWMFLFHFRHFYLNYTHVFDKPSPLCFGFFYQFNFLGPCGCSSMFLYTLKQLKPLYLDVLSPAWVFHICQNNIFSN